MVVDVHPKEFDRLKVKDSFFLIFNTFAMPSGPLSQYLMEDMPVMLDDSDSDDDKVDQSNCKYKRVHEEFFMRYPGACLDRLVCRLCASACVLGIHIILFVHHT